MSKSVARTDGILVMRIHSTVKHRRTVSYTNFVKNSSKTKTRQILSQINTERQMHAYRNKSRLQIAIICDVIVTYFRIQVRPLFGTYRYSEYRVAKLFWTIFQNTVLNV